MNSAIAPTPPRLVYALSEGARFLLEINRLLLLHPWLRRARRGDAHPVMVLPGFLGSDGSTAALRYYMTQWGYETHGWGLGRNLGVRADDTGLESRLQQRVGELVRLHGRKISLVGWSLGGVLARELARACPEHVRQVITLGSPIGGNPKATTIWRLYEMTTNSELESETWKDRITQMSKAVPGVPCAAIYSNSDGIVSPTIAREPNTPITENIRVVASHLGLGFSAAVLYAIADRLAQPEGNWQPFERHGWRRIVYG